MFDPSDRRKDRKDNVAKKESGERPVCQNKRARVNYFIDETYEAGIVLVEIGRAHV